MVAGPGAPTRPLVTRMLTSKSVGAVARQRKRAALATRHPPPRALPASCPQAHKSNAHHHARLPPGGVQGWRACLPHAHRVPHPWGAISCRKAAILTLPTPNDHRSLELHVPAPNWAAGCRALSDARRRRWHWLPRRFPGRQTGYVPNIFMNSVSLEQLRWVITHADHSLHRPASTSGPRASCTECVWALTAGGV